MGVTAENLAEKYNISREDCDKFALASQDRSVKLYCGISFSISLVSVRVLLDVEGIL